MSAWFSVYLIFIIAEIASCVHLVSIGSPRKDPDRYWSVYWNWTHVEALALAVSMALSGLDPLSLLGLLLLFYAIAYFMYWIRGGHDHDRRNKKRAVSKMRNKAKVIRENLHRRTRLAS